MTDFPSILAITMGDAAGVGPEIVARALTQEEVHQWCRPLAIGTVDILTRAGQLVGSPLAWRKVSTPAEVRFQPGTVDVLDPGNLTWDEVTPGTVCPAAGKAAAEYVLRAGELALAGEVEAVVSAPLEPQPPGYTWDVPAEVIPGPLTERLAAMARRYQVWLQPGSIYERDGDAIYNTALVFSPQGELVARYRKIFPWRPWEELAGGREFCTFDIPDVGCFGLRICYDGWFPEVVRTLVWMGAEVILHPSLTSTVDRSAELIIKQAHAIFNQCYMVNVNAAPTAGCGRSIVVDPHSRILQQASTHEEILTEMIDLVRQVRELGSIGLNQHLKQLRDFDGEFPIYTQGIRQGALFRDLGPLRLPRNLNHITNEETDT